MGEDGSNGNNGIFQNNGTNQNNQSILKITKICFVMRKGGFVTLRYEFVKKLF